MDTSKLRILAIPGVLLLIFFLSFSSQLLFGYIEPEPLTREEKLIFNSLILCLLVCYARACRIHPGEVPPGWEPSAIREHAAEPLNSESSDRVAEVQHTNASSISTGRWCSKCENYKPPRAHHCRVCQRCIPRMDHHCVWISNCVSHRTYPHFVRFIVYAVAAMSYLSYFLFVRFAVLWENRNMPSYLGPPVAALLHLFLLGIINFLTLFALSILLARTLWDIGGNTTTIEGWEIERHETLLRRARVLGGYLSGPNGTQVKIVRQEFPYDIGIWKNICQSMGTNNVLIWFSPFAPSLPLHGGLEFEVNGFEAPSVTWPPPDPDRIPMGPRSNHAQNGDLDRTPDFSNQVDMNAFRQRQENDRQRWEGMRRREPFYRRLEKDVRDERGSNAAELESISSEDSNSGEEAWRNSEGERLRDFGLDEDVEFYDEDEVPLSELVSRRQNSGDAT